MVVKKEEKMLLSAMRSGKSEFVAVFGRRRVGKTYLVQEAGTIMRFIFAESNL